VFQIFVALIALAALVIADARALEWTVERARALQDWIESR
jgi:hypothetical protein